MTSTDFSSINSGMANVPHMQLTDNAIGLNCIILSPLQMIGLGINGCLNASADNTGITCLATNTITGQQCEIPVFQGYKTDRPLVDTESQYAESRGVIVDNLAPVEEYVTGIVKLMKDTTPELSKLSYPGLDGLIAGTGQTARIFDNIRMAVATCGSPSRYYNRCYITGYDYTDSEGDLLTGRLFSGSRAVYGDRYYLVSLQYAKTIEYLFPVADAYFNLIHKLVPLNIAAPGLINISSNRTYLKCNIKRTNGNIQQGFIHLGREGMLIYKTPKNQATTASELIPYIIVYFNSDGSDILDVKNCEDETSEKPVFDSFKTVCLSDLLNENTAMQSYFVSDMSFENLTLKALYNLTKNTQQ